MWAVRLHRYVDRPRVEEVDEPGIERPYDVLVDIGGAGLCRTDLPIAEGQWADRSGVTLPYTLGLENAGWVREVGSAVAHLQPGETEASWYPNASRDRASSPPVGRRGW